MSQVISATEPKDNSTGVNRDTRWILFGIVGLSLLIRLLHYSAISSTAFLDITFNFSASDMHANWQWAQSILNGDWLGRNTYHPDFDWMKAIAPMEQWYRWWGGKEIFQQSPLYPYWIAVWLALSNRSLHFVILVQLILGSLQPLVMFFLGRRLFGNSAGLIAASITAVYGPFVFHQGALLRDWLPPFLEPLSLLLLVRAEEKEGILDWLLAGASLGMNVLIKETVLLFLPVVLLWLAIEHRKALKQAAIGAAILLLGVFLALSPLLVRNLLVGAPPFAISNRAIENFIQGNARDGFPIGLKNPESMKAILERSHGQLLDVIKETVRTHPQFWSSLVAIQLFKLRGLADPLEVPNNLDFYYGLEISPALRLTLRYGLIFSIGIAGIILSLKRWQKHLLLLLYGLCTLAALVSTIILARYRLVFVPVLILYGASALAGLLQALLSRNVATTMIILALILAAAWLEYRVVPIPVLREIPAITVHGPEYYFSAENYDERGEAGRAVSEMVRLRAKALRNPNASDVVAGSYRLEGDYRVDWATELFKEGNASEAIRQAKLAREAYVLNLKLTYLNNSALALASISPEYPENLVSFFNLILQMSNNPTAAPKIRLLLGWLQGAS